MPLVGPAVRDPLPAAARSRFGPDACFQGHDHVGRDAEFVGLHLRCLLARRCGRFRTHGRHRAPRGVGHHIVERLQ